MNKKPCLIVIVLSLLVAVFADAATFESVFSTAFTDKVTDGVLTPESEIAASTRTEVVFLDSGGNVKSSSLLKDNQFALLFADGEGFAVVTTRPKVRQMTEKIELFSRDGKALCSVKTKGFPFISPDGKLFLAADNFKNEISFYGNDGKMLSQYDFPDIKGLDAIFSNDSKYCLVNVPNVQKGTASGFLVFFDREGKKLWQFDHEGSTTGQVAISKDAANIIYSSDNEIFSLNKKGELNYKIPLVAGGIAIAISPDGKFIAVSRREDNSVSLFNAVNGKLIWKKHLEGLLGYNSPFTSIDVNDAGYVLAAVAKSWSTKNDVSHLYLFKDNELLKDATFTQQEIRVKFAHNNKDILAVMDKTIVLYALD